MSNKKKKLLLVIRFLILVCLGLIIYLAVSYHNLAQEYKEGQEAYDTLRQLLAEPQLAREPGLEQTAMGPGSGDQDRLVTDNYQDQGQESQSQTGESQKIEVKVDLKTLEGHYPDIIGWIKLPGTQIDYPILQASDNEYYLRRLYNGSYNILGSVFLDYRNQADLSDANSLIYGHNTKDGSMFASLSRYEKDSYYEKHPIIEIETRQASYNLELFAGIVVDGNNEDNIQRKFDSDADFLAYVDRLKGKSTFASSVSPEPGDRLVTLVTCVYVYDNARYSLYGRLVEK